MWDDFNHCWLAIAQKQKDLTGEMMQSGRQPQELLSADTIEKMCDEVVSLSDKMEPHGLVDYQLGFWEEEIISGECPATKKSLGLREKSVLSANQDTSSNGVLGTSPPGRARFERSTSTRKVIDLTPIGASILVNC